MQSDGLSYYLEGTTDRGVILIHGLTGAPAEMRLVARALHRKGFSVYAPLLAGHGRDVAALCGTQWQDWLASVVAAAKFLAAKGLKVSAAGICVGGKLGLMATSKRPDLVRAAALYSPCFRYDGWDVPFYYPLLSRQIGWLSHLPFVGRLNFPETASLGIKDYRMRRLIRGTRDDGILDTFPAQGLIEMHHLGKALKARLPSITTPTLILHSVEDDLSDARHARYIAEHIGGKHELHWIHDSYHMIHVDRSNRKVSALTADFFRKLDMQ